MFMLNVSAFLKIFTTLHEKLILFMINSSVIVLVFKSLSSHATTLHAESNHMHLKE